MKTEKGQALILIALGLIVLVGFTALAIDGGNAFADRRTAQNAADNAALAAAYSLATSSSQAQAQTAALNIATTNGYTEDTSVVEVEITNVPANACNNTGLGKDVTVTINSTVETMFAPVVGIDEVNNTVAAVARACESRNEPLLTGDAVIGLCNEEDCRSFESTSNAASWEITGGGLFANNIAYNQNSSITFPDGHCVAAAGDIDGKTFENPALTPCKTVNPGLQISYPDGAAALVPNAPECTGTAVVSGHNYSEQSGHEGKGSKVAFEKMGDMYFAPGIYCITGADKSSKVNIYGDDVLFWIMNPNTFEMKFAGGGGFFTSGRVSGPERFNGYMLIIPMSTNPCTGYASGKPVINLRGNADGGFTGTVLAPSACIDFRGNSTAAALNSQIIAYRVSSNGAGQIVVNYNADDNRKEAKPPSIDLLE